MSHEEMTNSVIYIEHVNEAFIKVHCDKSTEHELSEYFTFFAPGYQYHTLYKRNLWDGRVRLLNKFKHHLPAGLLPYVHVFAKQCGYHVEGYRWAVAQGTVEKFEPLWQDLNLHAHGKPIIPYDHQKQAVLEVINRKRLVIEASTSSGKSLISYILCRSFNQLNKRGLIVVPTIGLVTQLVNDFKDYSSHNGWDTDENVHFVVGGIDPNTDKPIICSTWQSIYNMEDPKWFQQWDYVIGDEAHKFQAKSLTKIMEQCTKAKYRVGMTGTVQDAEVHRLVLEGNFGPVVSVMSNRKAMDQGISAEMEIACLVLKYPAEEALKVIPMDYKEEIDYLVTNEARNNFIVNLALSQTKNTLVLVQYVVKHGQPIHDTLVSRSKDRAIHFVHGGTPAEDREQIRRIAEQEPNAIIVASYGVFQEGVSIRNLHAMIFASPSKSKIRVLQSIGRTMRVSTTKSTAKVFDIADDLHYGKKANYSLKHYLERIKLYKREQFKVHIHNIDLMRKPNEQ
ncbi:MAG: DEAD/DEAH box helicase family protein [Candidatus Dormibacteria bacterium]